MSQSDPSKEHYSYAAYADPAMAQSFDRRRFGGPIGEYVAGTQARVLANMVGRITDRSIVDVGTGTGRAAILMARGGARVTALDASEQMLEVARQRAADERLQIRFFQGDAHALQFADREFDVAICLRVLMHAPDWQTCLAELCRVAERLVIFDYPAAMSAALLESISRKMVQTMGARTEAYRVFSDRSIRQALQRSSFRVRSTHRQFVMPIQFHKAIGSRTFTMWSEDVLDRIGLLKRFGSPVTVVAERCGR
ncbi:MAG TPA: methyltransferase domain-containing protein [Vicinamibacterales bacterium]|nr:methyltransferase domain-containing protein [Vicinamibacterales bacterium]